MLCELMLLPLLIIAAGWLWSPWWELLLLPWAGLVGWSLFKKECHWWGGSMDSFPTRGREVLILIDGAPHGMELAPALDLLSQYKARALFMVTGLRAKRHPELVRHIVSAGHAVGCGMLVPDMPEFWRLTPGRLRSELRASVEAVRNAMPEGAELRWFRAPGDLNHPLLQETLVDMQLERVGWTVADDGPLLKDREAVLLRLRQGIRPGAIILLRHGQMDARGEATFLWLLEETLLWLQGQGYSMG
jgi:peptidoglycan/xylan/chitin deacetylase (PgdA/CDA1 family)